MTKCLFCGTLPAMNKYTAIIGTVLVLSNPHLALHPAHVLAAPVVPTSSAIALPTLTLTQILTNTSTTAQLIKPVIQPIVEIPAAPVETVQQTAERMVTAHYGVGHFTAFAKVVNRESTWNPDAVNSESGACGLGQALPCTKTPDHSVTGQLKWMIAYIDDRYGTPEIAWQAEQTKGWY